MASPKVETKLQFPKGFLIGAAASAYQVEGNNTNTDWWYYEQQGKLPKSGEAADHYNRFEEDFTLAQNLGLNAMRISIEWARIEPKAGKWDKEAVEHYKKVLKTMKEKGMVRMVTLWHWTIPKWFADRGGFEKKEGIEAFTRYCWFVAQNLGSEIDLWVILNEPEIYAHLAYAAGKYPPFRKSQLKYLFVLQNLISAHKKAYDAIKSVYKDAQIGIAKNSSYHEAYRKNNLFDRITVYFADKIGNHYILEKLQKKLDFIGINYYFYTRLKFDFIHGFQEMNANFISGQMSLKDATDRSDMGWKLYPQGIYHTLLDLRRYKLPIYVTENGLADAVDSRRPKFLAETLEWLMKTIKQKVDLRGYFHWSLTDNFEWTEGFGPRFGLIEIDYTTQKRKPRKSAEIIKQITYGQ